MEATFSPPGWCVDGKKKELIEPQVKLLLERISQVASTPGKFYPVTAYPADKKDRREYEEWKAGNNNE